MTGPTSRTNTPPLIQNDLVQDQERRVRPRHGSPIPAAQNIITDPTSWHQQIEQQRPFILNFDVTRQERNELTGEIQTLAQMILPDGTVTWTGAELEPDSPSPENLLGAPIGLEFDTPGPNGETDGYWVTTLGRGRVWISEA